MMLSMKAKKFTICDVFDSLNEGWKLFLKSPKISIGYTFIFVVIGLILFSGLIKFDIAPMIFPVAGGFMLVGPIVLSGFFTIADHVNNHESLRLSEVVLSLKNAPSQLWVISLICTMLFFVWITDAATLYAFMINETKTKTYYHLPWGVDISHEIVAFEFWCSIAGSIIALMILTISAFSVPLLYQKRTNLVTAITLSAKTIFGNFISSMFWAFLLSVVTITSILLLPLFLITMPVLAFASYCLYNKVFTFTEN